MSTPRTFEPRLLRLRKRRALNQFRQAGFLHARSAADLAERLEAIPRRFERVLALGGGGLFTQAVGERALLAQRIDQILEADIANGAVVVDPERPPFAEQSFDLIVSPLLLHWVNDLPGALIQLRRALRPDGLLLASLFGGDTLRELRLALLEAESELSSGAAMRVSPFAGLQDAAALAQRAGFSMPAADRDLLTVRYASPAALLHDLRAMGETAAFVAEERRALSRRVLARALELYRDRFSDADGRSRATFEVLTIAGWAPHEDQPKPLRPGSARTRLADALGVREHRVTDAQDPSR